MEYHKLTGNQPPAMYVREIGQLHVREYPKPVGIWKWLWHTIFTKPFPKVYSWSVWCQLEDNGYLVFSDIVEIHGIKYIVYQYDGSSIVLVTVEFHNSPPDSEHLRARLKGAQVIHAGSTYTLE